MADTKIASLSAGTAAATDRIPTAVSPYGAGDNAYLSLSAINTFLAAATKTLTNTTYDTAGTSNVFKINGTTISDITGTGKAVLQTAPTVATSLTITEAVGSSALTLTGATQTASKPVIDATQTWNSGGVTFTGWKLNVTDTASASASLLMDLQVGGASKASVKKDGTITAAGPVLVPDGSNASPTLAFSGATGQGFYRAGAATVFASSGADIFWQGASYLTMRSNMSLAWSSGTTAGSTTDTILTRAGVATLQFGAADATNDPVTPAVAQTLQVQSVATNANNTNRSGYDFTIKASAGTGSGTSGSIIFSSAPSGGAATTQNTYKQFMAIVSGTLGGTTNSTALAFSSTAGVQTYDPMIDVSASGCLRICRKDNGTGTVIGYDGTYSGMTTGSGGRYAFSSTAVHTTLSSADTILARGAAKVISVEAASSAGGTIRYIATAPAQITADQNNYNPGGSSFFQRWNTDAARNITGMTFTAAQVDGQTHIIVNVGSQNIVLVHQSASSTAANRFLNSTGADITLSANQSAYLIYDNTQSRWLVFKNN